MNVFIPSGIAELRAFYGEELLDGRSFPRVLDQLEAISIKLFEGLKTNLPCLLSEINNYHTEFLGVSRDQLSKRSWTIGDCRHCIALEYGFHNWSDLENKCAVPRNHLFEDCVNDLLHGNLEGLRKSIVENSDLLYQRSQFGHEATLLHYVASNGVEMWRQVVPENIVQITQCLIEAGADKEATMSIYKGAFNTMELVKTSAHPKEAGVLDDLVLLLQ